VGLSPKEHEPLLHTKKRLGRAGIGLLVALAVVGTSDMGALAQSTTDPSVSSTTEAPVSEAPVTTETPAPSTTEAPPTTTASTSTDEAAASPTTTAPARVRRGPDPRWVDFGNCGRGYTACHVAKRYQNQGKFLWRNGRWFAWGTDRVRGHPSATWDNFRREARLVRLYVFAVLVHRHRQNLVARWSGVARCESGGNWAIATGNGYYGGLQFNLGTWRAYGGSGMPNQRPAWYQASIAERVRTQSGLHHWPHCGRYYG
jgi:hypothetical protein